MADKNKELLDSLEQNINRLEGQIKEFITSHPPTEAWMKEYNAYVLTYTNVLQFHKLKEEMKFI